MSGRESNVAESDVSHEICVVSDQFPVVAPKLAAVPLAISVVDQTRPCVGRGQDSPLLVDEGRESLPEDGLDVILSGRESAVRMSVVACVWYRISSRLLCLGWLRCLWLSLWSLRRHHGLAGARTCPCLWTGGGSPSLTIVWT